MRKENILIALGLSSFKGTQIGALIRDLYGMLCLGGWSVHMICVHTIGGV